MTQFYIFCCRESPLNQIKLWKNNKPPVTFKNLAHLKFGIRTWYENIIDHPLHIKVSTHLNYILTKAQLQNGTVSATQFQKIKLWYDTPTQTNLLPAYLLLREFDIYWIQTSANKINWLPLFTNSPKGLNSID